MIKQLHVISSMDPTSGGPAQVIRYLLPHFDKNKTTADVVCLDKKDDFAFENSNINTIPLGKSVGPWQHNKNLYPWLMKNLAGYNLVVIHGLWLYNSFAVIRVLRKIKKDNLKFILQMMTADLI